MMFRIATKKRIDKINSQLGVREYEPILIVDDEKLLEDRNIDHRTVVFIDDICLKKKRKGSKDES